MEVKKNGKKKRIFCWIIFLCVIFLELSCISNYIQCVSKNRIGVYSWRMDKINYGEVKKLVKDLEINSFYQYVPVSQINSNKEFTEFVDFLDSVDVDTYFLCGAPKYGYDDEILEIKKIVDAVYKYNLNNKTKLHGIVLDAEFYLDNRYKTEDKRTCFEIYCKNMKKAHEYSKEKGIELILVIPYWLDTEFGDEGLEMLIRDACDSIEVMNYYKAKSYEHIKSEVEFAQKYDKSIVTISELQEANDDNTITEEITFYKDGLVASRNDMLNILQKYKYDKFGYAYHYYDYLIELYDRDEIIPRFF